MITAHIIEGKVSEVIQNTMTNPEELRKRIESIQGNKQNALLRLKRKLQKTEGHFNLIQQKKKRVMDLYANGDLDRETYTKKSVELDEELKATGLLKLELSKQIPMIHKEAEIDMAIKQYCETVRLKYEKCTDFDSHRKFNLEFIDHITHYNDGFTLHGKIPVGLEPNQSYLEFKVEKKITNADRGKRRLLWHGY